MMEAEVAKMQQAMAIQQTGALPMPWDGASPPPWQGEDRCIEDVKAPEVAMHVYNLFIHFMFLLKWVLSAHSSLRP